MGVAAFLLSACQSPRGDQTKAATTHSPAQYVRVNQTRDRCLTLEIAVRRFTPRGHESPSVWLVGVSHLGDPDYFKTVETLLAHQEVVLYEGVRPEGGDRRHATPSRQAALRRQAEESLQGSMARSLGLVFQLAAVDYAKTNFTHSDLSLSAMEKLFAQGSSKSDEKASQGEDETKSGRPQFDMLVEAMDNSSSLNRLIRAFLGILESSERLQALARLAMIRLMGEVGDDLESLTKSDPGMDRLLKVLLKARNDKVLADLHSTLRTGKGKRGVAIFYGAGHMRDLDARLRTKLGYQEREERWLPAFGVDMKAAGVSALEERMVHSLVRSQTEALRGR